MLSSTNNREDYDGDGATRDWPITFPVTGIESDEITVYYVEADGTENLLSSSYEVDLTAPEVTYPTVASGLPVLTTAESIVILRELDLLQEIDYKNQGTLPAETIETGLDRLTMMVQQLDEEVGRCVQVSVSDSTTPAELLQLLEDAVADAEAAQAGAELAEANTQALFDTSVFNAIEVDNDETDTYGLYLHQDGVLDANKYGLFVTGAAQVNTNSHLAVIFQTTGSTQTALNVINEGTGSGIDIDQLEDGIALEINNDGAKMAVYLHQDGVLEEASPALFVHGVAANVNANSALVKFHQDHASSTEPALELKQDGIGAGLEIAQTGNGNAIEITNNGVLSGIYVNQVGELNAARHALFVYSGAAQTNDSLVSIEQAAGGSD